MIQDKKVKWDIYFNTNHTIVDNVNRMKNEKVSAPKEKLKDSGFGSNYSCPVAKRKLYEKGDQLEIERSLNRVSSALNRATDYALTVTPKLNVFQSLANKISLAFSR